jgi:hypothetical protein
MVLGFAVLTSIRLRIAVLRPYGLHFPLDNMFNDYNILESANKTAKKLRPQDRKAAESEGKSWVN